MVEKLGGFGKGAARMVIEKELASQFSITLEGCEPIRGSSDERVLVSLERARGNGSLALTGCSLPVGCRRGGCGVCRARVILGTYECATMSEAHVTPQDRKEGLVLACSIYPRDNISLRFEPRVKREV